MIFEYHPIIVESYSLLTDKGTMPPRGARKAASSAVAVSPPRSPEDQKRKLIGEDREPTSPLRRSKRVKTAGVSAASLSTIPIKLETGSEVNTASPGTSRNNKARQGKAAASAAAAAAVKQEVEEEIETTVTVKAPTEDNVNSVKEEVAEEKVSKTVKVSRQQKTKEAEMVPLRSRTQGLRMLVGAHVSAAKGASTWLPVYLMNCCPGTNNRYRRFQLGEQQHAHRVSPIESPSGGHRLTRRQRKRICSLPQVAKEMGQSTPSG